jgi:hypothetical protein
MALLQKLWWSDYDNKHITSALREMFLEACLDKSCYWLSITSYGEGADASLRQTIIPLSHSKRVLLNEQFSFLPHNH